MIHVVQSVNDKLLQFLEDSQLEATDPIEDEGVANEENGKEVGKEEKTSETIIEEKGKFMKERQSRSC